MKTLLIVEDDVQTQEMMASILQKDYVLRFACDSQETWEQLHATSIDLVLMDVSLHAKDNGLDLTRSIRERPDFSALPIIAVTAHAFPADRVRCLEAGCNDYFTKPFRISELKDAIRKHLVKEPVQQ